MKIYLYLEFLCESGYPFPKTVYQILHKNEQKINLGKLAVAQSFVALV